MATRIWRTMTVWCACTGFLTTTIASTSSSVSRPFVVSHRSTAASANSMDRSLLNGACVSPLQCNARQCADCACVDGNCKCTDGWSGPTCETPFCVNRTDGCSGHGTCQITPHNRTCQCDSSYIGPHCANQSHCQLNCVHGGQPDEACSTCTGCLVAWVGPTCNVYNASIDSATLLSMYTTFFQQLSTQQEGYVTAITATRKPVPGWMSVGAAYDLVPEFMGANSVGLMLYNLSFSKGSTITDGQGNKYDVPDQLTAAISMDLHESRALKDLPEVSLGFRQLQDFTEFQATALSTGTGITGYMAGLQDPASLNAQFYQKGVALSRYRTDVIAYNLTLQSDSSVTDTPASLNQWARYGILSLPETYDTSTKPIFDKFFDTFGTSVSTSVTHGGTKENILAWYSCIWKGASPQPPGSDHGSMSGLQNCVLDASNFETSIASRSYGGQSHPVSTTKVGGNPLCFNDTCWASSIATNFSFVVATNFQARSRISSLLSDLGVASQALQAAEKDRIDNAISTAIDTAKAASTSDATGPRQIVLQTDAYGACKEGPMNIGDTWSTTCFQYKATGSMTADSDGAPKIQLGASGAVAVSCGCSVAAISSLGDKLRSKGSQYAHLCFECGVGEKGSLARLLDQEYH